MNPTDEYEIQQILMSLPSKKSSGYDNLSLLDIKIFGEQIGLPLAILINKSIVEGIVPQELKIATIIPVFQMTFQIIDLYQYYLQFQKILETIVYRRTYNFIKNKYRITSNMVLVKITLK